MDWLRRRPVSYVDEPDDGYIETARERARQAVSTLGLNVEDQREALPDFRAFGELFSIEGSPCPNAIQEQSAWRTPLDEQLVIIESETGSGKTEAALWRFARMFDENLVDGLYFALPTRAAAKQLHNRVTTFAANMFAAEDRPEPVLAAPGYVRAGDFTGKHLPDFKVLWDDRPDTESGKRRWAAEGSKRFLAAQIAVGTGRPGDDGRAPSQARAHARGVLDSQLAGCRRSARFGSIHAGHTGGAS